MIVSINFIKHRKINNLIRLAWIVHRCADTVGGWHHDGSCGVAYRGGGDELDDEGVGDVAVGDVSTDGVQVGPCGRQWPS